MGHCTLYYYTVLTALTKVSSLIWQECSSTATTAGGNWVPPAAHAGTQGGEVLGPRQEALQVGNDYMPERKKAQFPCHMILGNK